MFQVFLTVALYLLWFGLFCLEQGYIFLLNILYILYPPMSRVLGRGLTCSLFYRLKLLSNKSSPRKPTQSCNTSWIVFPLGIRLSEYSSVVLAALEVDIGKHCKEHEEENPEKKEAINAMAMVGFLNSRCTDI